MTERQRWNEEVHDRQKWYRKTIDDVARVVSHGGLSFDQSERVLTLYAARFGKVGEKPDHDGDVILSGAFDSWLRRWRADPEKEYPATGGKLLVIESHGWKDLDNVLGYCEVDDVTVDSRGLLCACRLFDTAQAKRAWELARDVGIGASFAFETAKGGEYTRNGVNYIKEFERIIEVGPTTFGANDLAGTIAVKDVDRAVAEFKAFTDFVYERRPELLVREIEGYVAKARAQRKASGRCVCGAYLPARAGVEVEAVAEDGTVISLGHIRYSECPNCGVLDMRPDNAKTAMQFDADDVARVIFDDINERFEVELKAEADRLGAIERRRAKAHRFLDEMDAFLKDAVPNSGRPAANNGKALAAQIADFEKTIREEANR
jgi:HK97 family phage prohead protease